MIRLFPLFCLAVVFSTSCKNGEWVGPKEPPEPFKMGLADVALPAPAAQIAVAGETTCALLDDGAVYCWGDNRFHSLGVTWPVASSTPLRIAGLSNSIVQIDGLGTPTDARSPEPWHENSGFVAMDSEGRIYMWGGIGFTATDE
jgi:hypothetical protein